MACSFKKLEYLGKNGKPVFKCEQCHGKVAADQPPRSSLCPIADKERIEANKAEWPSIIQSGRNLIGAVARFAADPQFVADDVYENRLSICRQCPWMVTTQLGERCKKCSCFLSSLIGKAKLATERCPLGKWPDDSN